MKRLFVLICLVTMVLLPALAQATPIPGDLTITGGVGFDTGFYLSEGTSSGDINMTVGGAPTLSTFTDMPPAPDSLMGTLTDTGDGFGTDGSANVAAPEDGSAPEEFSVGVDMFIDVTNNSLADTYKVTFTTNYDNMVNSSGVDAYSDSEFTVDDPGGEVFFTALVSDTMNGNEVGGIPVAGFGGPLSESGSSSFDVIFGPGDTGSVVGDWTLNGGAFESTAFANFNAFLSVSNVENLTSMSVPDAGVLALLGPALAGLLFVRRHQKFGS